jgi:hypothetical protein
MYRAHLSHHSTAGTTLAMVAVLGGNNIELVNHLSHSQRKKNVYCEQFLQAGITQTTTQRRDHDRRVAYVAHGMNALRHRGQVRGQQDIVVFLQYKKRKKTRKKKKKYSLLNACGLNRNSLDESTHCNRRYDERAYCHEFLLECLSRDGWQAVTKTRDLSL